MTHSQAQALAERLTRVWKSSEWGGHFFEREREFISQEYGVGFTLRWKHGHINVYEKGPYVWFQIENGALEFDNGHIINASHREHLAQFAGQWLPFFRRGCFLSGCDVEASAHEKAEWCEGFSREELKSWDLKF